MIAPVYIAPQTSEVVQQVGCPENKPYYVEVRSNQWTCVDEERADRLNTDSTNAFFIALVLTIGFILLVGIMLSLFMSW